MCALRLGFLNLKKYAAFQKANATSNNAMIKYDRTQLNEKENQKKNI